MRLIDAEAFLKTENDRCGSALLVGTCTSDNEYLSERLKKAPTIEVKPVVHGRWIPLTECANEGVYCSICKKKVWKLDYAQCSKKSRNKLESNYCPNCGAKMDEKENDK